MKYNIFITGRPGSGKSTLTRYLLEGFNLPWAGYQTIKTGACPVGPIYELKAFPTGEHRPISCYKDGRIQPVSDTFDTLGADCLHSAIQGPEPIILMDEIGRFEKNSAVFLNAICSAVNSEKTVIAVLKKEPLPYLEQMRQMKDAIVVDLDECSPEEARKQLAALLWPEKTLRWGLTLRLYGVDKSFGPGPMRLLEGVQRTGSLHKAAAEMGMAYSKAWKLLKGLEDQWGFPLLESKPGGQGGGKSVLTQQGQKLLVRYKAMLAQVEAAAEQAFQDQFGSNAPF